MVLGCIPGRPHQAEFKATQAPGTALGSCRQFFFGQTIALIKNKSQPCLMVVFIFHQLNAESLAVPPEFTEP